MKLGAQLKTNPICPLCQKPLVLNACKACAFEVVYGFRRRNKKFRRYIAHIQYRGLSLEFERGMVIAYQNNRLNQHSETDIHLKARRGTEINRHFFSKIEKLILLQ